MDVLGADCVPPDVHDIANRNVAKNIQHPEYMVHSRDVSIVSVVVKDSSRWCYPFVLQQVIIPWDIATAHVCETISQVGLLPLPPETVDIGVMQVEKWVPRAGALELELYILSAMQSSGKEPGFEGVLTVPDTAR